MTALREEAARHAHRAGVLADRIDAELANVRSDADSLGVAGVSALASAHATIALALLAVAQSDDDTPTKGDAPPEPS